VHPHHPIFAAFVLLLSAILALFLAIAVKLGLSLESAWGLTPLVVLLILSLKGKGSYWWTLAGVGFVYGLIYYRLPAARPALPPLAIFVALLVAVAFLLGHHIQVNSRPRRRT
jgi:hypothetical protein